MTCFTTKTTIPFGKTVDRPYVYTTLVDDHIWILFDKVRDSMYPKRILYKYNIETLKLETVDCVFPDDFTGSVINFTSYQRNICVTMLQEVGFLQTRDVIFELDVKTLQWKHVIYPHFDGIYPSFGQIVGDYMYVVAHNREVEKFLKKINLKTLEITDIQHPNVPRYDDLSLMENNGEIYAMHHRTIDNIIVVSKVESEGVEEVNNYCYDMVERQTLRWIHHIQVKNGLVLKVDGCFRDYDCQLVYLYLFDFTRLKWNRTDLPNFKSKVNKTLGSWIVKENKLYVVFMELLDEMTFSIQMIEKTPTLSTICMLTQIDKTNEANGFDKFKDDLSIPARLKLDNMLEWRIPENQTKLAELQKIEAARESMKMEIDGVVDHKLQRKLLGAFNSDFSDQSGSDITDADDEPFEESDDENNARYFFSSEEIQDERSSSIFF